MILEINTLFELSEEEVEQGIVNELKSLSEMMPLAVSNITLDVKLVGLEEYCSRRIVVPYIMPLSDMCYTVLATFWAEASHLFAFEYKNLKFFNYESDFEEGLPLDDISLNMLELRKNSKLLLT